MQGLRSALNAVIAGVFLSAAARTAGAQTPASRNNRADVAEFAVASIRENASKQGAWRLGFTPDGYSALGVTAKQLVEDAYGVYEDDRVRGLPKWADSEKYDVEAKIDPGQISTWQGMYIEQRRTALQALLRDRLNLSLRQATENRAVYELVIAKDGPRLQESRPEGAPTTAGKEPFPTVRRTKPGQLITESITTAKFAGLLFQLGLVSRHVIDLTGLTGHYDITLNWDPEDAAAPADLSSPVPVASTMPASPAIFAAMREQLGLELKPGEGPVKVLVIDRIDHPSAN
jgi:uncharacterized protein (TIGR03435 family)